MIIKPNLGARIFSGTAGAVLIILACTGVTIPFPGLIFTCLGFPLAVFAFGFAFGAAQTRVDDEGIFQRNFFFMSKKLAWNAIESGRIVSQQYDHKTSSGWTERRTRTYVEFKGGDMKININANSSGAENWWHEMRRIAREKMGDKFDG